MMHRTGRVAGRPQRSLSRLSLGLLLLFLAAVLALLKLGAVSSGLRERRGFVTFGQQDPLPNTWDFGQELDGPPDISSSYSDEVMKLVDGTARHVEKQSLYFDAEDIEDDELAAAYTRIKGHVDSAAYSVRVTALEASNLTGIVIPAGGPRLTVNLLVTLKVLRQHFNCTLPIEVMWQNKKEMDPVTWHNIEKMFAPITGVNIGAAAHPVPGLHIRKLEPTKYTGKVFSLLLSKFRHVLLLDADSMPVQNPLRFFKHPQYLGSGNLFWPDAWHGLVKPEAYELFGLDPGPTKGVLFRGKGYTGLDAESGQLLIDRAQHLDVLEYLLWINSKPDDFESLAWGDKDTYGMAFAVAGKAHMFTQVPVPPAGVFAWHDHMLLIKATREKQWGWQLLGFLQHDSWGQPAFIHRTINKFVPDAEPWAMELVTAPMPRRWTSYYLAQDNHGPTMGVPWDYVVPASAVTELTLDQNSPKAQWVYSLHGGLKPDTAFPRLKGIAWPSFAPSETCPDPDLFLRLWAMKESALPIDMDPELVSGCMVLLQAALGPRMYSQYRRKGWLHMPSMRYLDYAHMAGVPRDWGIREAATPLPAWRANFSDPRMPLGPYASAVKAAYQAAAWARAHKNLFPILKT